MNQLINSQVNKILQQELSEFINNIKTTASYLSENTIGDFEDITMDITQEKGNGWKAATSGVGGVGGALGGAALGSMIFPGIGTLIGGLLGSLFGGTAGAAIGDEFVETEIVTEKIGVSTRNMIAKTEKMVKEKLPNIVDVVFNDVINNIESVQKFAQAISKEIDQFSDKIQTIKAIKL